MASSNVYASSLRSDHVSREKTVEEGVPFFVPHLAKVKTNVMCQMKNQHLLFCYEKAAMTASGPTSPTVCYRKQGNQDFYSTDNLHKRQQLLEDKQVLVAINRFWETFPIVRHGHQFIEKRDYVDVFMKFFKALVVPSEFSMGEARKIVEKDWERDVGTSDTMSKVLFFRALFEVADIWTIGIGADIYVSFLNKLFDRVTMTVFDQEKSVWITVFAELDKVRSFMESKDAYPSTPALIAPSTVATSHDFYAKASSVAIQKPRPPLPKKKAMAVDGASSLTKTSSSAVDFGDGSGGGEILSRLPEVMPYHPQYNDNGAPLPKSSASSKSPFYQSQLSQRESTASNGPASTRSDSAFGNSSVGSASVDGSDFDTNDEHHGSSSTATVSTAKSVGRRYKRSSVLKGTPTNTVRHSAVDELMSADSPSEATASRPGVPELPSPSIRLAMPSIYLSPDLSYSQATERAARRRIRESAKLAQRLRRITY